MEITSWEQWLDTLGTALSKAQSMKMPKKLLTKSAAELGDFLFDTIDPDVPENRLLKKMWEVADRKEKEALANVMIKLVEKRTTH
ncbi:MAG TPA: DUF3243 domain-containing protein [Clostridia bacterium]|nr:DUF3243 domain-containing protein [Clostridia bacterium]